MRRKIHPVRTPVNPHKPATFMLKLNPNLDITFRRLEYLRNPPAPVLCKIQYCHILKNQKSITQKKSHNQLPYNISAPVTQNNNSATAVTRNKTTACPGATAAASGIGRTATAVGTAMSCVTSAARAAEAAHSAIPRAASAARVQ
jgi:hypothetical protein